MFEIEILMIPRPPLLHLCPSGNTMSLLFEEAPTYIFESCVTSNNGDSSCQVECSHYIETS